MKRLMILVVVGFLGSLATSAAFAGNNGKSNGEHSMSSNMHFSSEHFEKDHFEKDHCYPCDKSHCDKYWRETSYCFHDCTCDAYYDCFYDSCFDCYCYYDCDHVCRHCDKSYCCDKSCSKPPFVNTIHPIPAPKPTHPITPITTIHPIVNPIVHNPTRTK